MTSMFRATTAFATVCAMAALNAWARAPQHFHLVLNAPPSRAIAARPTSCLPTV